MTKFKLVGMIALSLLAATPAVAIAQGNHHHGYSHRVTVGERVRNAYGSVYDTYGFDTGGNFTSGNVSGDFDRRNTFN